MSAITPAMIKEVRERTGIAMGKCKRALEESSGDIDLAIENLRKSGMASAVKKEGRQTNEGAIEALAEGNALALVELSAETDFVVSNAGFRNFLTALTKQVLRNRPTNVEELMKQPFIEDESVTVEEQRALTIQSIGENIQIKRLMIIDKGDDEQLGVYSHMHGKILSVVKVKCAKDVSELAHDLAMQIAASSPEYVRPEEISDELKEKEREIARSQVAGKPANIIDNIVEGKLNAYYKEVCLLFQPFFKEPKKSVQEVIDLTTKSIQVPIQVLEQVRWSVK